MYAINFVFSVYFSCFPSPTLGTIYAADIRLVFMNEKNILLYMQSGFKDDMIEVYSK